MKNFSVWSWSWSRLFLPGVGSDPSRLEPESAPGPWTSGAGAAQKSGGSATLRETQKVWTSSRKDWRTVGTERISEGSKMTSPKMTRTRDYRTSNGYHRREPRGLPDDQRTSTSKSKYLQKIACLIFPSMCAVLATFSYAAAISSFSRCPSSSLSR